MSQAGADELQMLSGLGSDDTVDLLQILNSSPQELARKAANPAFAASLARAAAAQGVRA